MDHPHQEIGEIHVVRRPQVNPARVARVNQGSRAPREEKDLRVQDIGLPSEAGVHLPPRVKVGSPVHLQAHQTGRVAVDQVNQERAAQVQAQVIGAVTAGTLIYVR